MDEENKEHNDIVFLRSLLNSVVADYIWLSDKVNHINTLHMRYKSRRPGSDIARISFLHRDVAESRCRDAKEQLKQLATTIMMR